MERIMRVLGREVVRVRLEKMVLSMLLVWMLLLALMPLLLWMLLATWMLLLLLLPVSMVSRAAKSAKKLC